VTNPDQWQADMQLLGATHPFARAVGAMLDQAVANETAGVCQPSLSDGQRQFNAGRLAAMNDIATLYHDIVATAPKP
jgi:hypothetical protein